jgi:hypothetical protein
MCIIIGLFYFLLPAFVLFSSAVASHTCTASIPIDELQDKHLFFLLSVSQHIACLSELPNNESPENNRGQRKLNQIAKEDLKKIILHFQISSPAISTLTSR